MISDRPLGRATIKDVAAAAGVSRSTASRALTGNGYTAPQVRERVRAIASELGYVVDATARDLKKGASTSIGVLVSDLRNPFYAELASGIGGEAHARGRTIVLVDLHGSAADELAAAETLVGARVSGVIATAVSDALAEFLARRYVPLVEVDRRFDPQRTDAVVVDNRAAARDITERLLALGHRRIALLIDETEWTSGAERQHGYLDALAAHGVRPDESLIVRAGWDADAATETATAVLASPDRPTAVFAANNVLAEGAWRATLALGLRVPDDVSVVAFDDAPWMTMVQPGLSTCRQDLAGLGAAAVVALLGRIQDPSRAVHTDVLPTEFVDRGSLAPPAEVAASARPRSRRAPASV